MKKWTIKNFRGHDAAYACDVFLDGKKVISARQDGRGGCNVYHTYPDAPAGTLAAFKEMAREWGIANKAPYLSEIEDQWVIFQHDGPIMNWTAERFLNMTLEDLR